MTFLNPTIAFNSELRFLNKPLGIRQLKGEISPGRKGAEVATDLVIRGQGTFIFTCTRPCSITFRTMDGADTLRIALYTQQIQLFRNDQLLESDNQTGLTVDAKAFYWLSLDAKRQRIAFGIGEARQETERFCYDFGTSAKSFLERFSTLLYDPRLLTSLRLLRTPIQNRIPLFVKNTDELTMEAIARSSVMPRATLSPIGQKLYDTISGSNFALNSPDFPHFAEAIDHSIATPGCWCHTRLMEKAGEFRANPNMVYLRITLGQNEGESPGIPYVMEIWPAGCFSPVHNHAGANAIIRVLHGSIRVCLYPYLGAATPFGDQVFQTEDITWISPVLNQIHHLENPSQQGTACVTIQCYMYDESDTGHYNYFDYMDADEGGKIGHFEPDSDMDFIDFKARMKQEWEQRAYVFFGQTKSTSLAHSE